MIFVSTFVSFNDETLRRVWDGRRVAGTNSPTIRLSPEEVFVRINHLAVIVAAVVYWLFGGLWYGLIFKGAWMSLTGITSGGDATNAMITSTLMALVLAYTTGIALTGTTHAQPARHGVEFGLFMGVGIFASQTLMDFMFEARPVALWAIDAGHVVLGMVIIGAVVGAWQKKAVA
jgi:hypothetical protein